MDLAIPLIVSPLLLFLFLASLGCFPHIPLPIDNNKSNHSALHYPIPDLANYLFPLTLGPSSEVVALRFRLVPFWRNLWAFLFVFDSGSCLHQSPLNRCHLIMALSDGVNLSMIG